MADIAEQICLAVDQIVTERLKSIKYDTTIVATIIDASMADENKYICSTGTAQFVAFSKDVTYKVNESVQVTIPNNDYDQQKIIIGRYVVDGQIPFAFVQPFDTIVDVTTNLISNNTEPIFGSLLANEDYDKINGIESKEIVIWSQFFESGYSGFNRLGIQGQFRSWLAALKPKLGNFGYRLEIMSSSSKIIENNWIVAEWINIYSAISTEKSYDALGLIDSTPNKWFTNVKDTLKLVSNTSNFKKAFIKSFESYEKFSEERKNMVFALLYANGLQITNLFLDSSEMYGNPYNFQNFFEQERVYDVSNLKVIYGMTLYFYEDSGSFYNTTSEPLKYTTVTGTRLPDNLFTKDPYICLGYDLSEFSEEQAILYTTDSETFIVSDKLDHALNFKTIRLRWLHMFENGQIKVISEDSEISDYEIRWYRFSMGAPSADEYSGVYWVRVNEDSISPFNYVLMPSVNVAQEQVKVIVLYDDKIIRSNILTFTNEKEIASGATTDIISGLSLWCKDDSYGNYFLYGQNNNLINETKANEILTLEARFAESSLLAENYNVDQTAPALQEASQIIWEFPLNYTMISVHGFNYNYEVYEDEIDENLGIIKWNVIAQKDPTGRRFKLPGYYGDAKIQVFGNTIYITRDCKEDGSIFNSQDYRIKKTYNASSINNTVKCSIKKDSMLYSTAKEMSFGIMGTNGTDATIVIDFNNNKTALTAALATDPVTGKLVGESLAITAHLYDYNHKEVDFNNLGLGLTCKWEWAYYYQGLIRDRSSSGSGNVAEDVIKPFVESYKNSHPDASSADIWNYQNSIAKIKLKSTTSNVCYLEHSEPLNIGGTKNVDVFFLILQVTVSGWGDYDLIAYKAIPIRKNAQFRNFIGPTEIIYSSAGYPNYYKQPLELWWCPDPTKVNAFYDVVAEGYETSKFATTWFTYNPYYEVNNYVATISNNIIKPPMVFTSNTDPYGVICYENVTSGEIDPVWIQPLVIMQNEYPSSTINKWDGKGIQIDDDNGVILSPAIAAGHKNNDNSFSGVMIGSWRHTDTEESISEMTGVYGFHQGKMAYAFKEDGTGFIGKSNRGRIEFDGNTGILKSSNWQVGINETGMFLDLDQGILKLQKESGYDSIPLTSNTYVPGRYYTLETSYNQVPLGTSYSSTTTYYKKAMVPLSRMTENVFKAKVEKRQLYIKTANIYIQCDKNTPYAFSNKYYTYLYIDMPDLTKDEFDINPSAYYVLSEDGKTYLQAPPAFNEESHYYYKVFNLTSVTKKEYEANPGNYWLESEGNYKLVSSSANYNKLQTYYEYGYEAQDYGMSDVPDQWNTIEDLGEGNYYYTLSTKYVLSTAIYFDPTETYYENNVGLTSRYITLSADANRFPLAIGNHSSVAARKFRVDWNGTCYIQDGIFSGIIDAESGYLGDLILRGSLTMGVNGYIAANKTDLYDLSTSGFYLNAEGLNIGSSLNYFIATIASTLFFNDNGAIKVSGQGIDFFGNVKATKDEFDKLTQPDEEGIIHMGWHQGDVNYPYVRFGFGTSTSNFHDAGIVKKFSSGMWIGTYGENQSGYSPEGDATIRVGVFCDSDKNTVYRCEHINGARVFEPARYARFAPDSVT